MFKRIASEFRKPRGIMGSIIALIMEKSNSNAYKEAIKLLDIGEEENILEIGYGPGDGIWRIAEKYRNATVHGVDFSKLMYESAGKKNRKYIESKQVELFCGDISDYIPTVQYNKIFGINIVYFWNSPIDIFKKLFNMLELDGALVFFVVTPEELSKLKFTNNESFKKYKIDDVVEDLRRSGFERIETTKCNTKLEGGVFIKAYKK